MSKQSKKLMEQNIHREKGLNKENVEDYTNMIAYIRSGHLTEYDIELVRSDLIEMVLDAQSRGDSLDKVFGNNYKEICDDIIAALTEKTLKERVFFNLNILLTCTFVLGIIQLLVNITRDIISRNGFNTFSLTNGEILSMVLIFLLAYGFVNYVAKTALNKDEDASKKQTIKELGIIFLLFILIILPSVFLNKIVIETSYWVALSLLLIIFVLNKIVENYVK